LKPSRRTLGVLALLALSALVVAFFPATELVWVVVALGFLVALVGDAVAGGWRAPLEFERVELEALPLDAWTEITVDLSNPNDGAVTVELFDGVPGTMETEDLPRPVTLAAASRARIVYRVRPQRRGRAIFEPAHLLRRSRLGLWTLVQRAGDAQEVLVLPNFRPIVRYALLAVANRLEQMGIRKKPRRGMGKSFHQLREYREGDLLQQIDWKATARRHELISREYQEERDQQVVFLLDCGQRMRSVDGATSHFDHCLNAVLLLSYVALRQGDSVALMTFAGEERWLPPVKGAHGVQRVLDTIFDLEATDAPSDYSEAARRVLTLQRKRSLVVWLTNLRGEDASEVLPAVATLRQRHVSLVASLREARVDAFLEEEPRGFEDAITAGAAAAYCEEREGVVAALRSAGARALDLRAPELPVALANEYLDMKSSGVL